VMSHPFSEHLFAAFGAAAKDRAARAPSRNPKEVSHAR